MGAKGHGGPVGGNGHGTLVVVAVVTLVAASLLLAVLLGFRAGVYALASLLATIAVVRAVLPVRLVGPLAVRSRLVDVTTTAALAVGLLLLVQGVPDQL